MLVFFCLVAGVVLMVSIVWSLRCAVAMRVVRGVLEKQGLHDVSFRLSYVSPYRVVVEDLCFGNTERLLTVERVDLRFSVQDLLRRHLERVHVQGVHTTLMADGGKLFSPLVERLQPLVQAAQAKRGAAASTVNEGCQCFSLWMATLRDVQVDVVSGEGVPITSLTLDAGVVSEATDRYRMWGRVQDDRSFHLKTEGSVRVDTGAVTVTPELVIDDVGQFIDRARVVIPSQIELASVITTNGSLTVRGSLAVTNWTQVGPFQLNVEFGRGSAFSVPSKDVFVRFQTMRIDCSGTPMDVLCRVNAGVSGFRVGGQFEASQEEGRMVSLRGAARFLQRATNQWVTATLDSDLQGRSIAKVLPRMLPLVPVFFSDGGTFHMEADICRPLLGLWQGQVNFSAETLRSSVPLAAGRVGAGLVRVSGNLAIEDTRPGLLRTDIKLENGYFFRQNLSVKGDGEAILKTRPPYAVASGTFKGQVRESIALQQRNLAIGEGAMPFEGEALVSGLISNPVWQIAVKIPEFDVVSTQQAARVEARVGATAAVRYGSLTMALEGELWAREVAASFGARSNRVGDAGAGRIAARFKVSEFSRAQASNAVADVIFDVSNGWSKVGSQTVLEDLRCEVPFSLSLAKGLVFQPQQRLAWHVLKTQGLQVLPDVFSVGLCDHVVEARIGVRVSESKLGVDVLASVPLADPRRMTIEVTLPDTELCSDDAVAAAIRDKALGAEVTGHLTAEAKMKFLGSQPHILGRVKMSDGRIHRGKVDVEGVMADISFESGVSFRTIQRPFVSFIRARAGNILFEKGRFAFQLTPQELFADRMEVEWCKGSLRAYSVHLEFKNPHDDFIVYADRIDLGEALMMVMPFKGEMEGVLYGRFPVGYDKGHVKLSTGFLYSLPGQGGKLRLDDNRQMMSLLEKSGIKGDVQVPLSKALSDMDFNTFKMELEPKAEGDGTLKIKMVGRSNDKAWPAPVDLNLNLHGPLEELLNMGIGVTRK